MADPQVTIVVVPRERFSLTRLCLERLYAETQLPFALVYVDGGSPNKTKRYLQTQAEERGFRLIRIEHYLSPNQARNLGFSHVKSRYVVFIDNDVLVTPGWLDSLVRCAEETGAWVVGPLCCIGKSELQTIHVAGGITDIREAQGNRNFYDELRFTGQRLADIRQNLRRERCSFAEFHCMLVHTKVFELLGMLDESFLSSLEHDDLCLAVCRAGGTIYFEPGSLVTHLLPPPFAWSDLPYFLLRWSDAWNQASLRHFCGKWNLPQNPHLRENSEWLTQHRQLVLQRVRNAIRRVLGWRLGIKVERTLLAPAEIAFNRWLVHHLWGRRQQSACSALASATKSYER